MSTFKLKYDHLTSQQLSMMLQLYNTVVIIDVVFAFVVALHHQR